MKPTSNLQSKVASAFHELSGRFALGAASFGLLLALSGVAQGQTLTVLYSFTGGGDGGSPGGPLVMDTSGALYGTTEFSGNGAGYGTVFKLSSSGELTTLHSFACPDGANPSAGVIRGPYGSLYGTIFYGGIKNYGVVFKVGKNDKETVLHHFQGSPDGFEPFGELVRDPAGNLYGITPVGGANRCGDGASCGTVFAVDGKGHETVLYSFAGSPDGSRPLAELTSDANGNLYGTTEQGGQSCSQYYGCGTVFKLAPNSNGSWSETVLHRFSFGDGWQPEGPVLRDADENLYGTASLGGNTGGVCGGLGCGTIVKLSPGGQFTVLHKFKAAKTYKNGYEPAGNLVSDKDGNLYGTAGGGYGSRGGNGIIYKLSKSGKLTILYRFHGADGAGVVGLLRDNAGNLYGPGGGGAYGWGEVYKLSPK